jgi:hypothetical protein
MSLTPDAEMCRAVWVKAAFLAGGLANHPDVNAGDKDAAARL